MTSVVVVVVSFTFHGAIDCPIYWAFAHHEDQRVRFAHLAVATLIHVAIVLVLVSTMLGKVVLNAAKRQVCGSPIGVGTLIGHVSVDPGVAVATQTTTFGLLAIVMKVLLC